MEVCSGTWHNKHDEVVHADGTCPLCVLMQEKSDLEDKVEELHKLITYTHDLQEKECRGFKEKITEMELQAQESQDLKDKVSELHKLVNDLEEQIRELS